MPAIISTRRWSRYFFCGDVPKLFRKKTGRNFFTRQDCADCIKWYPGEITIRYIWLWIYNIRALAGKRYWHPGTYIVRSIVLMRTLTLVWIQTNNTDAKRLGTPFLKYSNRETGRGSPLLVSCLAVCVTLNRPIFNYKNFICFLYVSSIFYNIRQISLSWKQIINKKKNLFSHTHTHVIVWETDIHIDTGFWMHNFRSNS